MEYYLLVIKFYIKYVLYKTLEPQLVGSNLESQLVVSNREPWLVGSIRGVGKSNITKSRFIDFLTSYWKIKN